jgi:hypothetical protein
MFRWLDQPEGAAVALRLLLTCIGVGGYIVATGIIATGWPISGLRLVSAAVAEEGQAAPADNAPPLSQERHPPPVINYVPPKAKAESKRGAVDDIRKKKSDAKAKSKKPTSPKAKAAKPKTG